MSSKLTSIHAILPLMKCIDAGVKTVEHFGKAILHLALHAETLKDDIFAPVNNTTPARSSQCTDLVVHRPNII